MDLHLAQGTSKFMIFSMHNNMAKKASLIFSFKAFFYCTDMNQISYPNEIVVLLFQPNHYCSRAAQWLDCLCAHILYLWLKWPWATRWTLATPGPLTPLSLWICKEFLITLSVWRALNTYVKLCTLTHITPQLQPPVALHTKTEPSCSGLLG